MKRSISLFLLLLPTLIPSVAAARISHVPENFLTIQEAIDATRNGDTVIVDPGVYEENLLFRGRQVVLGSYLLTIGGDVWVGETILDGGGHASVVTFEGGETERSTLRGFTIRNGEGAWGGGVSVLAGTHVTLEDLIIEDNHASLKGGGLYAIRSDPVVRGLTIRGNSADQAGGGVFFREAEPEMTACRITQNRAPSAAGLFSDASDILLHRVVIDNNVSEEAGAVELWGGRGGGGGTSLLNHLTIVGNRGGEDLSAGLIINTEDAENIQVTLANSILWRNSRSEIILRDGGNEWDGLASLIVRYSDIEHGRDSTVVGDHGELEWQETNFARDPAFRDMEGSEYLLTNESPCIDAGDPDEEPDEDGSRPDLGALGIWVSGMFIAGSVLDSETGEPIPYAGGLGVANNGFVMLVECDSSGVWSQSDIPRIQGVELSVSAEGYLPKVGAFDVPDVDSFYVEMRLDHATFAVVIDTVSAVLDSGESSTSRLTIRNGGNGTLTWRSEVRNSEPGGSPPWTMRAQISVTDATGDDRIEGVIFDGENYYLAGANGESPNRIWVLNRRGGVIRTFNQPGRSRLGFRDLEWDGELIWGSNEDTIYAFDRTGQIERRWIGPHVTNSNIAFDPGRDVLWISGATTDIVAYDREGNALGMSIPRNGLRISGLAWLPDANDSLNLLVLNNPEQNEYLIAGVNPTRGDTTYFRPVQAENAGGVSGLFVCQNWDEYSGSVLMTLQNITLLNGGDRLDIIQLQPNRQWAKTIPSQGLVEAGGETEIELTISTSNEDFNWGLRGGDYSGEIVFSHDGMGEAVSVPVELTVIPPALVENVDPGPGVYGIVALYPQPFNSTVTVEFVTLSQSSLRLALYDVAGREVRQESPGRVQQGTHRWTFDAEGLGSGVYLLRIEGDSGAWSRKAVLVR